MAQSDDGFDTMRILIGVSFLAHTFLSYSIALNENRLRSIAAESVLFSILFNNTYKGDFSVSVVIVVHCFEHLENRRFLSRRQANPTVKKLLHVRGELYHVCIGEEL